jgi:O-acetyl-ADP-ribose deacetylase (regulator of RNase III)
MANLLHHNNILTIASDRGFQTLVLCSISTGLYGYPKEEAVNIMVTTVRRFLKRTSLKAVMFCLADQESCR